MYTIFQSIDVKEFKSRFQDDDACLEFLANEKWENGYKCRKCGHDHYCSGRTPYSRRCTKCKHEESATSHTVFHRCRIPLHQAFEIAYMVCTAPDISSHEISRRINIRQMTCWSFKKKIVECIEKRKDFSKIEVDELKAIFDSPEE